MRDLGSASGEAIDPGWNFGCKGAFGDVEKGPDAGPLSGQRILQVGNSLATNSASYDMAALDQTGASYLFDSMPGSSPIDGSSVFGCIFWQQTFPRLVAQFKPTIVVAEYCCNYWYTQTDASGHPINPGTDACPPLSTADRSPVTDERMELSDRPRDPAQT